MSTASHGHMHKDKFLPTDRVTMFAKIIKTEKAKKEPEPGSYFKDFPKPKIIGLAKQKSE